MRRSRWFEIAGLDYLRVAFRVTRQVDPAAKLIVNDYNTEYPRKRDALFLFRSLAAYKTVDTCGKAGQHEVEGEQR